MRRVVVLISLALAACDPQTQIVDNLQKLKGHDVKSAIAIYGYPTDTKTIVGDTVLIWKNEYNPMADIDPCTMRVFAGPDGIIKGGDVSGSPRACRAFL